MTTEWQNFEYFTVLRGVFLPQECDAIIALQSEGRPMHSVMETVDKVVRDSNLFWLYRNDATAWMWDRFRGALDEWNQGYRYEVNGGLPSLQLTSYGPDQSYETHVDIGAKQASRRKITGVLQLNDPASYRGGGLSMVYDVDNVVPVALGQGDMVVFHSWVQHRADRVTSGKRWSLVGWYLGENHLV